MKARYLRMTPELWTEILKDRRVQRFRVIRNALPEDAKCVGIEISSPMVISLLIVSSVFNDDDPDQLPLPILETIPKGE
jgi:hypothetical protein